jgi:Mrp family chromosome partitioning ATPase
MPADARVISRATVSNIPAYPKKVPAVLIATLTALIIGIGFVLTKELLAAPAGGVAMAPRRKSTLEPDEAPFESEAAASRLGAVLKAMRRTSSPPQASFQAHSFDDIVDTLENDGGVERRIAIFGAAPGMDASWTALKFARAFAAHSRVILVGLGAADEAIRATSHDPSASGLAELAARTASFRDVITKDQQSGLHLISSGHMPTDRSDVLVAPSMATNFAALARGYDRVIIAAGTTTGPELEAIAALAPYAILAAGTLTEAGTAAAYDRLLNAGFAEVAVLGAAGETMQAAAA